MAELITHEQMMELLQKCYDGAMKGIINLAKMVPFLGGVVGGTIDLVETKAIAEKATKAFLENVIE